MARSNILYAAQSQQQNVDNTPRDKYFGIGKEECIKRIAAKLLPHYERQGGNRYYSASLYALTGEGSPSHQHDLALTNADGTRVTVQVADIAKYASEKITDFSIRDIELNKALYRFVKGYKLTESETLKITNKLITIGNYLQEHNLGQPADWGNRHSQPTTPVPSRESSPSRSRAATLSASRSTTPVARRAGRDSQDLPVAEVVADNSSPPRANRRPSYLRQ